MTQQSPSARNPAIQFAVRDKRTRAIVSVMSALRDEWEQFPVHVGMLFLCVADADASGDPLTVGETSKLIGMSEASTSRNIRIMASGQPGRASSMGQPLLVLTQHPNDHRARLVRLTPYGAEVYKKITSEFEKAVKNVVLPTR